ncbi:putative Ankyrin repeat protein [Hibiscus syriacus]|uniref:Ankyrin repeat protein n=1 Tax=Hibiscus syriacus TaxID=106335 RepID=A0A6A3AUI6_HIBSY|nr:putative Ankyrin repeat protein [Hibiscus syriacus]
MDESLRTASLTGNVGDLYRLIRIDGNALRRFEDVEFVDTPLHIAAEQGCIRFAMEIMNLKPSFARKLNQDGLSPMHLAVEKGHKEMALRFMEMDKDVVRVKGKSGKTPLHLVSKVGNHDGMLDRFLEACPECVLDVTTKNRTALHIATKNKRLDVLQVLIRMLRKKDKDYYREVVNRKDEDGNTALHIAAGNNQPQMLRLLLDCKANKHATNQAGSTALDVAIGQSYRESISILRGCCIPRVSNFKYKMEKQIAKYLTKASSLIFSDMDNISGEDRNALLVILGLLLTVTFQAALSPPGGVWQDESSSESKGSYDRLSLGMSVLPQYEFLLFYVPTYVVFIVTFFLTLALLKPFPNGFRTTLQFLIASAIDDYLRSCHSFRSHRAYRGRARQSGVKETRLRVCSLNVGTLNARLLELTDVLSNRKIDFACIQETRWKGARARECNGYKLCVCPTLRSIPEYQKVFIGGDFNGHIGSATDGYDGVHGGFSFGSRNEEGRTLGTTKEIPNIVATTKAYDSIPRDTIWKNLEMIWIPTAYIRAIRDMYCRSTTYIRTTVGDTEAFPVEIGLHQGSALSPYILALIMDDIYCSTPDGVPWCMLFADDIVLVAEKKTELNSRLTTWMTALEEKCIRINIEKTQYLCSNFSGNQNDEDVEVCIEGHILPSNDCFKYLGSMIHKDGGVDDDVTHQCWAIKKDHVRKMEAVEMRMLRWVCGRTLWDMKPNSAIRKSLGVVPVSEKLREGRLRWFGHVLRRSSTEAALNLALGAAYYPTSPLPHYIWE